MNIKYMIADTCFIGTKNNKGEIINPAGNKKLYFHVNKGELYLGSKVNQNGDIFGHKAVMTLKDDTKPIEKSLVKATGRLYKKTKGLTSDLVHEVRCSKANLFSGILKLFK